MPSRNRVVLELQCQDFVSIDHLDKQLYTKYITNVIRTEPVRLTNIGETRSCSCDLLW